MGFPDLLFIHPSSFRFILLHTHMCAFLHVCADTCTIAHTQHTQELIYKPVWSSEREMISQMSFWGKERVSVFMQIDISTFCCLQNSVVWNEKLSTQSRPLNPSLFLIFRVCFCHFNHLSDSNVISSKKRGCCVIYVALDCWETAQNSRNSNTSLTKKMLVRNSSTATKQQYDLKT